MAVLTTKSQLNAMQITERVTSVLSLFGILFILATFLLGRGFDKPINRLIFFASWSNLMFNIASLIAEDGVAAGQDSHLCQFQAWVIQMFLGVDVFWALCMSVNVYLALFRGWTAQRMRTQEWKYFVGCYGCALVPAIVYLFVQTEKRGRVYGPAVLWCWIDARWDFLRVATLYGIVWVAILFAFCIYCLAFIKIWRHRHELTGLFNPFNEDPFAGTIKTEINVVSTYNPGDASKVDTERGMPHFLGQEERDTSFDPYTVNVEAEDRRPSKSEIPHLISLTRAAALESANPEAWLYARVAFLFFCALLISWVPSSINRLYSLANPDKLNFGLNYTETFVLPLQGFWNAVVYIITSQIACRNLWRSMTGKPHLPATNNYGADVDYGHAAAKSTKGSNMTMSSFSKGSGDGFAKGMGTKLGRFSSRKESHRLRGDDTSLSSLTATHHH